MDALGLLGDGLADAGIHGFLVVGTLHQRFGRLQHRPLLLHEILADGDLDQAVQVDGHHALGARRNRSRSHGILVRGMVVAAIGLVQVGKRVTQAAAAGQRVGAVGQVAEETVPLGPHLGREIGILLVHEIVLAVGQQGHGLYREGKDIVIAFLIEPLHEMLLQPGEGLPLGSCSVREAEIAEHAAEIGLVEVADVPEYGLIAAVARRHVHGVHHLLEVVVDHLHQRTLFDVVLHHRVQFVQVVVPVVLADEIVQVHQELGRCHGTHELGRYGINQVDELATVGFQVGRCDGNAAQILQAAHQEGIHGNGHTIRITRRAALVMLVQDMVLQVLDVLARQLASVQGLDLVPHDVSVLLDVVFLIQLLAQRHDVFARDVGIGIELGARGSVGGSDVVLDEVTFLAEVHAGIEFFDVGHGHLLVNRHQALFNLTADLAAGNLVVDIQVLDNRYHNGLGAFLPGRFVRLADTIHQFNLVILLIRPVGLPY